MTIFEIVDSILFRPLQYLFELIYMNANNVIGSPGLSIIALSLVMNVLLLPLYKRADALQEEERQTEERLRRGVEQIKKAFKGDERMMILQTYYRQNHYKPTYVLRGAVSLMLEIPFFMAAYRFLSNLTLIQGVALGPIGDLGLPDGLLAIGGMHINVLPIIMTGVNLVSCVIFTKGAPLKSKLQLYGMAVFFLFFLYDSPSGLVFYWTLNNVFSLGKTIFYKLRNPQKLLRACASAAGIGMLIWILGFYRVHRPIFKAVVTAAGFGLQAPLVVSLYRKKKPHRLHEARKAEPGLFYTAGVFLMLFVGGYIPLSVIASSAQEFVNVRNYQNPLWFVVSSLCLAAGTFVVWPGVFYQLAEPKSKGFYEKGMCILAAVTILDFMAFGNDRGMLTSSLEYESGLTMTLKEAAVSCLCAVLVGAAVYWAVCRRSHYVRRVTAVLCMAVAGMIGINALRVNTQVGGIQYSAEENGQVPSYTMSKYGKNVVVVMMDRAMGELVPFIFNEKPELMEKFDGFTSYSNMLTFGKITHLGLPALLGGYDYTVENINKRADVSLRDKHNEALKVMPTLFSQNGYEVTVFQPTYANYQLIPDLSIYADMPGVRSFNTMGAYESPEVYKNWSTGNMRNFFMYGLMKASPILLQPYLYDHGTYNRSDVQREEIFAQTVTEDGHKAEGRSPTFMNSYNVLTNLPRILQVEESEANTFLFMTNETAHEPALLQEPDYTPELYVDNIQYDQEHLDRFTLGNTVLDVDDEMKYMMYEVNMAAMLKLGDWFDSLRENGVYDNTRIILVSDHGYDLFTNKERVLPDGMDTERFNSILLVKDFDAKGFSYSDDFMTTGDVPTLAMDGLIQNPINPFTGNPINSDPKNGTIHVFFSGVLDVQTNNAGYQFAPGDWYRVDNQNIKDLNNWVKVGENSVLPEE